MTEPEQKKQQPAGIKAWDAADRPREKMIALGASRLSPAELLAVLVGSGSRGETAVELMQRILSDCNGSLNTLGKMSLAQLRKYKGMGTAKALIVLAACELGRRRSLSFMEERPRVNNSKDIYNYFLPRMRDLSTEECHVLLLNNQLRVLRSAAIASGGITGTIVDVRVALREAITAGATAIALCHNHPSGVPKPSKADDDLTRRMKRAAEAVDIKFIDHIVLADGSYYSYADEQGL